MESKQLEYEPMRVTALQDLDGSQSAYYRALGNFFFNIGMIDQAIENYEQAEALTKRIEVNHET